MISKYTDPNNLQFRNSITQFAALCFVPEADIVRAFEEIQSKLDSSDSLEDDLEAFIGHFELSFIGRIRRNGNRGPPRHKIRIWNQFKNVQNKLCRTNNSVEGYHFALLNLLETYASENHLQTSYRKN